jgi:hypothetical protein
LDQRAQCQLDGIELDKVVDKASGTDSKGASRK